MNRYTIVNNFYYHKEENEPVTVETRISQPIINNSVQDPVIKNEKTTDQWRPIEMAWLVVEPNLLVVIKNTAKAINLGTLTAEQYLLMQSSHLEIGIINVGEILPFCSLPPGQTIQLHTDKLDQFVIRAKTIGKVLPYTTHVFQV